MRDITYRAKTAFNNNQYFHLQNTIVKPDCIIDSKGTKATALYLHCNRILWKDSNNTIYFSLCGWDTLTTCERLRGFGLPINHKKGKLYYDNIMIDCDSIYRINEDNTLTEL